MGQKEAGLGYGTIFFLCLFVVSALGIGQYVYIRTKDRAAASDNRKLTWGLCFLGSFCMWTLWICTYMHQMYPLIRPIPGGH
mmetsp:Transcript_31474/g.30811  ORF Transcript_31474/g.30811 Transcript_31474/m.30811 type:complete len:82 (-) Transcript_31474:47-292(-)